METDKHYLRVGLFVVLTLLGIAVFAVWLQDTFNKSKYTYYRIHFAESVSGLNVGGPVKFRGVQVGKVDDMLIDQKNTQLIQVDISILKTTPIKTDTTASLKIAGVTGGIYIELSSGSMQTAAIKPNKDKNNPPEITAEASTLSTIMDILPQILQKISHISEQADKLFSDKNIATFSDTMQNLQKSSHDVNQLTHSLKENPSRILFPPKDNGIPAP